MARVPLGERQGTRAVASAGRCQGGFRGDLMANARRSEFKSDQRFPGVWVKRREPRFDGVVEIFCRARYLGEARHAGGAFVGNRNGAIPLQFSCSNIRTARQGRERGKQQREKRLLERGQSRFQVEAFFDFERAASRLQHIIDLAVTRCDEDFEFGKAGACQHPIDKAKLICCADIVYGLGAGGLEDADALGFVFLLGRRLNVGGQRGRQLREKCFLLGGRQSVDRGRDLFRRGHRVDGGHYVFFLCWPGWPGFDASVRPRRFAPAEPCVGGVSESRTLLVLFEVGQDFSQAERFRCRSRGVVFLPRGIAQQQ
jgi:hypothetical protein